MTTFRVEGEDALYSLKGCHEIGLTYEMTICEDRQTYKCPRLGLKEVDDKFQIEISKEEIKEFEAKDDAAKNEKKFISSRKKIVNNQTYLKCLDELKQSYIKMNYSDRVYFEIAVLKYLRKGVF